MRAKEFSLRICDKDGENIALSFDSDGDPIDNVLLFDRADLAEPWQRMDVATQIAEAMQKWVQRYPSMGNGDDDE